MERQADSSHVYRSNIDCHYSYAAKLGKPKGSRNKKTLEKLGLLRADTGGTGSKAAREAATRDDQHQSSKSDGQGHPFASTSTAGSSMAATWLASPPVYPQLGDGWELPSHLKAGDIFSGPLDFDMSLPSSSSGGGLIHVSTAHPLHIAHLDGIKVVANMLPDTSPYWSLRPWTRICGL